MHRRCFCPSFRGPEKSKRATPKIKRDHSPYKGMERGQYPALLHFRGEPTHESVAVPKLNVVVVNELFDRLNGGGIVSVIVQKFGSNGIEMPVDADDVGAIVRQCCCSLDQAGAQNSQSPIKAEGGR